MNKGFSKAIPHVVAIVFFLIISFFYCSPVFNGKSLQGHDTTNWLGMAKESVDYNETHDDKTLWTNSMFGGMPTYQISAPQPNNILQFVDNVLGAIPRPVYFFFLYMVCFYLMALCFGLNPWLSIVASVAFTFASYNIIIIAAGHNSKAITIAYMAPLIGSIFLAFRSKRWLGALLTAVFLGLAVRANHVQILYYALIVLFFFGLVEFIYSIKEKTLKAFFTTFGVLVVAAIIGVGMNATSLLTTYEYSQYTMRGKSNGLTADTQNSQHGLNKDYITQWSYGIDETLTVLIPNFKGGSGSEVLDMNSETAKHLKGLGVSNAQIEQIIKQMPLYWGSQPFTSGPVYFGAIVCFLFVLSLFVVDRREKWWLLPMIILTLMLSWGRNFMWLTDIFIDYVPMYNKFRTVSMTLVATGFGVALMAFLGLKKIFDPSTDKSKLVRPIFISAGIVGGITLIFALIPSLAGDFVSSSDSQLSGDFAFLKETLPLDRKAALSGDAWRSLAFILLAAGALYLYTKNLLKEKVMYAVLGVLILVDMIPVDKRYLGNDNFESKRVVKEKIKPTAADSWILDNDKSYYRVLDATVNIFNDATPAYFHKNIGGYHAAKLRRYQELINMQIEPEMGKLFGALSGSTSIERITNAMDSLGVLNMLNMKYVIYSKEAQPLINPYANGNAWFINKVDVADDANQEMKLTGEIDTKREMVIDKTFGDKIPTVPALRDSAATIVLTNYQPNKLTYKVDTKTDQVAVFSEIYYDKGWNAYVDGVKVPYVRANYLLRAMQLKAGNYELVFKFEPSVYYAGNTITLISSILLVLVICAFGFMSWKKRSTEVSIQEKGKTSTKKKK